MSRSGWTVSKVALGLVLLSSGCGSDPADEDGSSTTDASGGTASSELTGDPSTQGTSTTGDEDGTSSSGQATSLDTTGSPEPDVPPLQPGPGRGLSVVGVESYQALRTAPDAGPGFAVSLLPGRPALLRFFVDIDEDLWDEVSPSGRTMVGRLLVRSAQGEELELLAEPFVFRDSTDYNIESTIAFEVPAQWVQPGLQYRLEVDEFYPELGVLPLPEQHPSFPPQAEALATLDVDPMPVIPPVLRVHIIPYDYQGNCSASVQLGEENLEILREDLATLYPVVELELTVADPVVWSATVNNLDPLLQDVLNRRAADNPAPDVYYAGFIDVCTDCPGCTGGFGYYADPTPQDAAFRVSINRTYSGTFQGLDYAQDMVRILSHELGHNHNLQHNACVNPTSDPGATDPSYPHGAGAIGSFGYRFSTDELVDDTTAYDLMTYCHPTWMSDWTWNRLANHIAALGSAVGMGSPSRDSVVISVDADGHPQRAWWQPMSAQTAERVEEEGDRMSVRIGVSTQQLAVRTIAVDHGDAKLLQLPLPREVDRDAGWLEVQTEAGAVRLDVSAHP